MNVMVFFRPSEVGISEFGNHQIHVVLERDPERKR